MRTFSTRIVYRILLVFTMISAVLIGRKIMEVGSGDVVSKSNQKQQSSGEFSHNDACGDYLDLIDVFGFIWRSKFWLLLGISAGVSGALVFSQSRKPPVFTTTLPVTFEVSGGVSFDASASKFNELLARAEVIHGYSAAGGDVINGKIPAKLIYQSNGLSIEINTILGDSTGAKPLALAQSLASSARELNQKLLTARQSMSAGKTSALASDLETKFAKLTTAQYLEEAPLRAKLFALESSLSQRAGGIRPTPAVVVQGAAIGDDVLRMLGALDSKITPNERANLISEYSRLAGLIRAIQVKYEQPIREVGAAMAVLSSGLISDAIGESGLFPVIVVNEMDFRGAIATGTHQRFESKRALFLILGAILGGMFGIACYGLKRFIVENRERILSVCRS
jgi:hypothetical protein